jgi:hypothetical protein
MRPVASPRRWATARPRRPRSTTWRCSPSTTVTMRRLARSSTRRSRSIARPTTPPARGPAAQPRGAGAPGRTARRCDRCPRGAHALDRDREDVPAIALDLVALSRARAGSGDLEGRGLRSPPRLEIHRLLGLDHEVDHDRAAIARWCGGSAARSNATWKSAPPSRRQADRARFGATVLSLGSLKPPGYPPWRARPEVWESRSPAFSSTSER